MKTSKVLAVAVLGVSFALVGNAIAQNAGGFQGPGVSDSTVAEALKMPDDTPVVLKGKVEKSLGNERYQFNDGTGVIVIEVDNEDWRGLTVTPEDTVEIKGEIEKDMLSAPEVDVDTVSLVK